MYNDICLIKFKYEVECTPDIRPVCLASDLPKEGDKCRVAGFGDTTGNDNYSSILNEGILSIENHSYCNQVSVNLQKVHCLSYSSTIQVIQNQLFPLHSP